MKKILIIIGFLTLASSLTPVSGQITTSNNENIEILKEKIKKDPYDIDNYCKFAEYYSSKGRPFLAISYYQKALEIYKDSIKAKYGLAKEYKRINKYDKALNIYLELLETDQFNHEKLYLEIGKTAFKSKRMDIAEKYLEKALDTKNKENKILYSFYTRTLESQNKYFRAIEVNELMIQNIPEEAAKGYSNIGRFYIKLKDLDLAIENYQKAVTLDPLSWYNYYIIGLIEKTNKHNDLAIEYFDKTISYNPTFKSAYKEIIEIYKGKGDDYLADMYFQKYKNSISKASSE